MSFAALLTAALAVLAVPQAPPAAPPFDPALLAEADRNADFAAEALARCRRYAAAWLALADPASGLIPTNTGGGRDLWTAANSGADNYPFLVLTAALTDRALLEGPLLAMLETERRLTTRAEGLPDDWSFARQDFRHAEPDPHRLLFGASEYVKDGLLPLTEWLGPSPWRERMLELVDAIVASTAWPGDDIEIHGEMLQTLSRVYWMTGERRYLERALELGDRYLLGPGHPTRGERPVRLRDHGCEVLSGLCELYVTLRHAEPARAEQYRAPLHEMLDRLLEIGRNEDGLFADQVDPRSGERRLFGPGARATDTFGYTLNGYHAVWLVDGTEAYREAVRTALGALWRGYRSHPWEGSSADGYADAIEGALNLHNREPIASCARWIDSETRVLWSKQRADGLIEGWHGDGNFARTSLMVALWKSQGTSVQPWREDLRLGAARDGARLVLRLRAAEPWRGALLLDRPRHRDFLHLPLDWPRINQFPEWWVAESGRRYRVHGLDGAAVRDLDGAELIAGLPLALAAGEARTIVVERMW